MGAHVTALRATPGIATRFDDGIPAHQRAFAHVLRRLYRAAVEARQFVVLMIV
jgi:hypothetical protein